MKVIFAAIKPWIFPAILAASIGFFVGTWLAKTRPEAVYEDGANIPTRPASQPREYRKAVGFCRLSARPNPWGRYSDLRVDIRLLGQLRGRKISVHRIAYFVRGKNLGENSEIKLIGSRPEVDFSGIASANYWQISPAKTEALVGGSGTLLFRFDIQLREQECEIDFKF